MRVLLPGENRRLDHQQRPTRRNQIHREGGSPGTNSASEAPAAENLQELLGEEPLLRVSQDHLPSEPFASARANHPETAEHDSQQAPRKRRKKDVRRSADSMAGPRKDGYSEDPYEPYENQAPIDATVHNNNPAVEHKEAPVSIEISKPAAGQAVSEVVQEDTAAALDLVFASKLKKEGLEIVPQRGDGNCLFRAVSLQVYGDANMHDQVRQSCLNFMAKDPEHFAPFVVEDFTQYVRRKRKDGCHGNNTEVQAMSELFNRPVHIYMPENGAKPINIFHGNYKTGDAPIRLSYHDGNHYNAIVDPSAPTAGVGLGLPGMLTPDIVDQRQVAQAVTESDILADEKELSRIVQESQEDDIERALRESVKSIQNINSNKAIVMSDVEATNLELEQAALQYSILDAGELKQRAVASSPPNKWGSLSGVASLPVASAKSASARPSPPPLRMPEDYPQSVQELVMNGFELSQVVRAYELIGDDFDKILMYLLSSS